MKLRCPECGLKGTADDGLLESKVRCPGCETVFRLTREATVARCAICDFRLGLDCLREIDGSFYCRVCAPR